MLTWNLWVGDAGVTKSKKEQQERNIGGEEGTHENSGSNCAARIISIVRRLKPSSLKGSAKFAMLSICVSEVTRFGSLTNILLESNLQIE